MTYERRPVLPAVVGPRAARVLLRTVDPRKLLEFAEALAAGPDPEHQATAREVRSAVAMMRECVRQWREDREGTGSACGTSELPDREGGARSELSLDHLGVVEVAERLDVSAGYVRRLCRDQILSATKSGRDWVIDVRSVAEYELARERAS